MPAKRGFDCSVLQYAQSSEISAVCTLFCMIGEICTVKSFVFPPPFYLNWTRQSKRFPPRFIVRFLISMDVRNKSKLELCYPAQK